MYADARDANIDVLRGKQQWNIIAFSIRLLAFGPVAEATPAVSIWSLTRDTVEDHTELPWGLIYGVCCSRLCIACAPAGGSHPYLIRHD